MASVSYISTAKLLSLISTADPQKILNIRVLDDTRLSLESANFQPIATIDLAEERIIATAGAIEKNIKIHNIQSDKGKYTLSAFGGTIISRSLKELLGSGLCIIEKNRPGTLDKLSKIKKSTKRIVAHSPELLFDTPGLSEKFATELMDGWWYGTNNSAQETTAWLMRACDCADIEWGGKDFSIEL